jgi:hypothetical protein
MPTYTLVPGIIADLESILAEIQASGTYDEQRLNEILTALGRLPALQGQATLSPKLLGLLGRVAEAVADITGTVPTEFQNLIERISGAQVHGIPTLESVEQMARFVGLAGQLTGEAPAMPGIFQRILTEGPVVSGVVTPQAARGLAELYAQVADMLSGDVPQIPKYLTDTINRLTTAMETGRSATLPTLANLASLWGPYAELGGEVVNVPEIAFDVLQRAIRSGPPERRRRALRVYDFLARALGGVPIQFGGGITV